MPQRTFFLWGPLIAGSLALGAAIHCGGSSGQPPQAAPPTATQAQFLQSAGRCANGLYTAFAQSAAALDTAAAAFAADPSAANRDAARRAWEGAIDLWQQVEVFQFGPTAAANLPGGQGLRDDVYAWPLVSRCEIEQTLVKDGYADPSVIAATRANARGLYALEYLFFYEGADNACDATSPLNAQGTWAALAAELPARKAAYARVVAGDVTQRAQALATAWAPGGGDFGTQVASAGAGSTVFSSAQEALNAINNALFYVEVEVKDQKLAIPLGLSPTRGCATPVNGICPGTTESPFANRSQRHLRNNLIGFRKLFLGCDDEAGAGIGFDDLLTSAGPDGADLAGQMTTQLNASFTALDALPEGALTDASLAAQKPAVTQVFTNVGNLVSLMKSQFLSVLNLEPPLRSEGDND